MARNPRVEPTKLDAWSGERTTTENVPSLGRRVLSEQARDLNERLMISSLKSGLRRLARWVYCYGFPDGHFASDCRFRAFGDGDGQHYLVRGAPYRRPDRIPRSIFIRNPVVSLECARGKRTMAELSRVLWLAIVKRFSGIPIVDPKRVSNARAIRIQIQAIYCWLIQLSIILTVLPDQTFPL